MLGEGGMAKVYSCWDTMLHVERAAKILNPALMRSQKVRERFLNEARTMARLQHSNIVQVVDVGMDGEEAFMVMELMTGGTLQDLINAHGPLAPHRACRVILSVLAGLATAHKAGVIHRDIKPQNILLDENSRPKVTDFGIAHFETPQKQMTRTGAVLGTVGFMAPEQRISARKVDGRADLYAVGTTLYAALTGQMPIDLYAAELDDELLKGLPEAIRPLIQKATRYKPEDRYSNAAAMAEAVRDAMALVPEGTRPVALPDLPSQGSETFNPGNLTGLAEVGVAAEPAERHYPAPPPPPPGLQGVSPVEGTLLPSLPDVTDVPVPVDPTRPGPKDQRETSQQRISIVGVAVGLLVGLLLVSGSVGAIVLALTWGPTQEFASETLIDEVDPTDGIEPTEPAPETQPTKPTASTTAPPQTGPDDGQVSAEAELPQPETAPDAEASHTQDPSSGEAEPEPEPDEDPDAAPDDAPTAASSAPSTQAESSSSPKPEPAAPPTTHEPKVDLKSLNGTWTGTFNDRPLTLNLMFNKKGAVGGTATLEILGAELSLKVTGTHKEDAQGNRSIHLVGKRVGGSVIIDGTIVGDTASGRIQVGSKDRGSWKAAH